MEILVATMILSICFLGLANIFVAATRKIAHSRYQMVAAELSKFWLEPFHSDVRQDILNTTCLGGGACPGVINYDGVAYTPIFTRSDFVMVGGQKVYKIRLTIDWNEL